MISHTSRLYTPAAVELRRRYPKALFPDRGGMRVPPRRSTAADVRVVAPAEDPEAQFPTEKHRLDHRDVRRVVVAAVGIVEDHHVPRLHVIPEMIADGLDREGARPHQHRDVGGLGSEPEPVVEHRSHEVLVLGEDGRAGAAQHARAHLAGHAFKTVGDDGQENGVHGPTPLPSLPARVSPAPCTRPGRVLSGTRDSCHGRRR